MPMRRISSAVHSAHRFTSAACCGSALMLGIARYALSSSTYLSRLVLMKSMTAFMSGPILPRNSGPNQWHGRSRHDLKAPAAVDPVHLEVAPVEREDAGDALALGHVDERRVGEIHRLVPIVLHQLPHPRHVVTPKGPEVDRAGGDHAPQRFLRSIRIPEEVHGFGEGGPDGQERSGER